MEVFTTESKKLSNKSQQLQDRSNELLSKITGEQSQSVGMWPWVSAIPMAGDNIELLSMRPSRNLKSLEGTKQGDSGDSLPSQVACSPAIMAWKLLGVCGCWAKLLT